MADLSGQFKVDGLVKQREELEHLLTSDPLMEKRIQALIRKVLLAARSEIGKGIKFDHGDPRQAYRAVKSAVYKRVLGGSVSILAKKRAGRRLEEPPVYHALEHRVNSKGNHRGGNRAPRTQRTKDLLTYAGPDRGFILRFLNAGTSDRTSRYGNRGHIAARNFFRDSSQQAMEKAAEQLDNLITELIKKELK